MIDGLRQSPATTPWARLGGGSAAAGPRRRGHTRFAHRGQVRYPRHADQTAQAHCHSLVVNACVLSTTGYLQDAIDAQRAAGHPVRDEAISHLSPGHCEPINPYGTLNFNVADMLERPRQPLRKDL